MSGATENSPAILLEVVCPKCSGKGGRDDYEGWITCRPCKGIGFIPTEVGAAVLDIVRHNIDHMVRDSMLRVLE